MKLLYWSLAFFLSLSHADPDPNPQQQPNDDTPEEKPPEQQQPQPCTIKSTASGAFFDLNPLHITRPDLSTGSGMGMARNYSWNTTGYDMGYNFTLNFCGGVVEDLEAKGGVVGLDKDMWRNVSAYYELGGKVYSIGQTSHHPVIRGRKLVLNYTHGSPCPNKPNYEDDDRDDDDTGTYPSSRQRRKTTIISMLCEKDPLYPKLGLSFIASPDECTYIFEARTHAGCAAANHQEQELSPSGVFGVIAIIAVAVYVVGGCVYSRMVLNQRGWKQLPNYNLWAGILNFFTDLFVVITSSCGRLIPGRQRPVYMNGGTGGLGRGRSGRDSEAENRLIDELNEEWDDL